MKQSLYWILFMRKNNAIFANETPSTYSEYSGLIAFPIISETSNLLLLLPSSKGQVELSEKYHSEMDANSYDSCTNVLQESFATGITFEGIMSTLYTKLTVSQEDLGHEFKSVYFKNAWDLYES